MIEEGSQFPSFSLSDQDGNVHTLESLKGKRTLIYFYPKDDTTGCTKEACEFRDTLPSFKDVQVIGVSPDPVKSHRKFVDKYSLNFPLLADTEKELVESLGIWVEKSMYGRKYMGVLRSTYLLDENGKIEKIWSNVKPEGHAAEVLSTLEG